MRVLKINCIILQQRSDNKMKKAINRFWDWLFHPSIRWYHYPKGKSACYRYPSPGSVIKQQHIEDYKTPFQHTKLNIRYTKPINSVTQENVRVFAADGVGVTILQKLQNCGLLEPGENREQQIELAKQKFLQKYGVPAQTKVYRDDFNGQFTIPDRNNRQQYRMMAENYFKEAREEKKNLNMPNSNRRFIQQPEAVWLESLDLYSNPHFQQTRIDVNYKLDNFANQNAKRGYIDIRKGEKSFWKALDDSNDPKNVEKVQKAIGDDKPTDFTLRDTKIVFEKDKQGNVVDVHPNTRGL